MPLIETTPDPAVQTCRLIRDTATGSFNQMLAAWQNGYRLLWANPYLLTPQQVCDAMGSDAVSMFTTSYASGEFLKSMGATLDNGLPAGWTWQPHEDGTVTLTQE